MQIILALFLSVSANARILGCFDLFPSLTTRTEIVNYWWIVHTMEMSESANIRLKANSIRVSIRELYLTVDRLGKTNNQESLDHQAELNTRIAKLSEELQALDAQAEDHDALARAYFERMTDAGQFLPR